MPIPMSSTGATLEARSRPFRQHPQVEQLAADRTATGTAPHHRVLVNLGATAGEGMVRKTEGLQVSTAREVMTGVRPHLIRDRLHRHHQRGDRTGATEQNHGLVIFRRLLAKADTHSLTRLAMAVLVSARNAGIVPRPLIPTSLLTEPAKNLAVHETRKNDHERAGADPGIRVIRAKGTRTIDQIVAGGSETETDPETRATSRGIGGKEGLVRAARSDETGLATEIVRETETYTDVECWRTSSARRHVEIWMRHTRHSSSSFFA